MTENSRQGLTLCANRFWRLKAEEREDWRRESVLGLAEKPERETEERARCMVPREILDQR